MPDKTVAELADEKRAWARSLADKAEAKRWLDFYQRYFATEDGEEHLRKLASGELKPLDSMSQAE